MNEFVNKVAIITGGGSGIGKSICLFLARRGAIVIIADRDIEGAKKTESQIHTEGGISEAVQINVSQEDEVKSLILNTMGQYNRIDYLFNNAGISINGEFQDIDIDYWHKIHNVNLWGVVYGCHFAYPIMQEQGFGHIINTASLAGLIPGGLTTVYSSSKHAVVGFSLTLRAEAEQYGIKVTTLCPGYVRTSIQDTTPNVTDYMNWEKNIQMNENMKFLTADDIVNQIMKGVKKNRAIIVAPRRHKIYWYLNRLFPSFIPFMFNKIIKKMKNP